MNFNYTEEQAAIRDLAMQIVGDASSPAQLRVIEDTQGDRFDSALWAKLAEAGLLGIAMPESVGGAGLGMLEAACVVTAAARHAAAVPVWETIGLGAPAIAEFGSEELIAKWLTGAADGSVILTAAWHEEVGDPLDPQVQATIDGSAASVSGTKVCVPAGTNAHAAVVAVSTGSDQAIVLVDLSAQGVERIAVRTTTGAPEATITFTNAPATVIAMGSDALRWAFERAVATQCAAALGTAEAALELTAEYTKERKQFGVPLASFQAVGHRAADTFIDTQSIRLTSMAALWLLDNDHDASDEVAIAQYWAAFSGQRIALASAHLHGGVGVDRDYPLHRYFIAAKQQELQLGGATQSLLRLGRQIAASA